MRCYVVMGVSGCGKSSIGRALSILCGMDFLDGDDLHPRQNIEKMSMGHPLNDQDRAPWLADVGRALATASGPIIIGCSALRRCYRDWIRVEVPEPIRFLHLDASKDVLASRVAGRIGHFMPTALLDSQFETLERLSPDEFGTEIDIARPYDDVLSHCETYVRETLI